MGMKECIHEVGTSNLNSMSVFFCLKNQGIFVEIFLYNMKMLIPVSREIGMGKIPHSSLMAHSHIPHSRLSSRSEK